MFLKKNIKVLHLGDTHLRHLGRLYYSTVRKISLGLIKNNVNLLQIGDRDMLTGTLFNRSDFLFDKIKVIIKNFRPDIVLFGHVDNLNYINLSTLKNKYKDIIFSQYFLDTLDKSFINFERHKSRFLNKAQFCDISFITSSPDQLDFVNKNKTFFIPNVVDSSIDFLRNFEKNNLPNLIFYALSHGQHRGGLKKEYRDERYKFIKYLKNKIKNSKIIGIDGVPPVWGTQFFNEISTCKMGLNYSRGNPVKYYSSDRIASLFGNGLLTFLQKGYNYEDFLKPDVEAIYFKSRTELVDKIKFYSKNDYLRKKIARQGCKKYNHLFDSLITTRYMLEKLLDLKITNRKVWMK